MYLSSIIPNSCQRSISPPIACERTKARLRFVRVVKDAIKKKHNLSLSGQGCTSHLDSQTTRATFFNFDANEEMDIDKVRLLSVKVALEILKLHLEDKNLQGFLFEFPFNIKNIAFDISMPTNKPNALVYWPNIKIVSFNKQHFHYRYYRCSKDEHDKTENLDDYISPNGKKIEGFRWALNEVKNDISFELLGVAAKLGLLDGNLEDEYRDADDENYDETQTKEFKIRFAKVLHKDGYLSEEELAKRIEEISRED